MGVIIHAYTATTWEAEERGSKLQDNPQPYYNFER